MRKKAAQVVDSCKVLLSQKTIQEIYELLKARRITRLWIEADYTNITMYRKYCQSFPGIMVSDSNRMDLLLKSMRAVKTAEEIACIAEAQRMTDDTFNYIIDRIKPGRTEREIMLDMEFYMRSLGSEGVSFDFIVVSGKNSSLPHGVPTDKPVETGDFVTMDFGAVYKGYHSDMTRTVAVGKVSDEQSKVYHTVLEAQRRAIEFAAPGKVCKDVDAIAREYIYKEGYCGCFGHGLGHSVGVEIHEEPAFNTRCETKIMPGMVITVEPGIYLENKFGVRIEDMILATETGVQNLTFSPKELLCL